MFSAGKQLRFQECRVPDHNEIIQEAWGTWIQKCIHNVYTETTEIVKLPIHSWRQYSTYCGRCSFGLLSSSAFPKLGFLELEAAVSDRSESSQLSEVLATVWPQRRLPPLWTPAPTPPTLFSLPSDAAFCRGRGDNEVHAEVMFALMESVLVT